MRREKWLEQFRKRRLKVVYLHDVRKLTFEEIGQRLGISRQRAAQLYHKEAP